MTLLEAQIFLGHQDSPTISREGESDKGTVEEGPGKDIDQPSELRINGPRTRVFFRRGLVLRDYS